MNGYQNYRRLFTISMVAYAFVLIVLVFMLFKPQSESSSPQLNVGDSVVITHTLVEGQTFSTTGIVRSMNSEWIKVRDKQSANETPGIGLSTVIPLDHVIMIKVFP